MIIIKITILLFFTFSLIIEKNELTFLNSLATDGRNKTCYY